MEVVFSPYCYKLSLSQRWIDKKKFLRTSRNLIHMDELVKFLQECRLNHVFPMSIYRITLPVRLKAILKQVKILDALVMLSQMRGESTMP